MARSFAESFRDPHEGRAVAEFFYLALETDFRDQLRAVERFAPDVLFVPGSFTDASLIASQAESLGLRATLLGADGWSSPLLFSRGAPPGPAYFVDLCSPPEVFSARYERAFGQPPQGCRAALAYDAVRAVAAGLDRIGVATPSGSDLSTVRRRLRDALGSVRFSGVTGRVRFDPVGDRRVGVAVEEVLPRRGEAPVIRLHSWVGAR
jgi:branched-chain amino acid transport system substrate-binding protein